MIPPQSNIFESQKTADRYTSIKWAEDELEVALSKAKKDAELHYYKGILQVSQHQYVDSLKEFNKAIKYADESTARHYFAKGFAESCLNMFKEGIEDMDIAIKLEQSYTDAYLVKGKCCYLAGDTNNAFVCYQQLIMLNKNNPVMHIHAGNLLMASGATDDAIKAFGNANELKETTIAYYQQAKVSSFPCLFSV